jgi:hypothetical protein
MRAESDVTMKRCHGVLIRSAIVVVIAAVSLLPLIG